MTQWQDLMWPAMAPNDASHATFSRLAQSIQVQTAFLCSVDNDAIKSEHVCVELLAECGPFQFPECVVRSHCTPFSLKETVPFCLADLPCVAPAARIPANIVSNSANKSFLEAEASNKQMSMSLLKLWQPLTREPNRLASGLIPVMWV